MSTARGPSFEARKSAPLRMTARLRLRRPQPLVETCDIDEPARVAAFADLPLALERLDREADDAALDRDHLCRGAHRGADQGGSEMLDIDLGTDRDPARLQMPADRIAGRHLHFQNHHR